MVNADREIMALLQLPADDLQQLQQKLIPLINQLINEDFDLVVNILYRVDVNEQKLKQVLQQNSGKNTPEIIAALIIERQVEKIRQRNLFKETGNDREKEW